MSDEINVSKSPKLSEFGDMYSITELSKAVGIHRSTLYRLIRNGSLRAVNLTPRCIRIPKSSWEEYCAKRTRVAEW